jgi:hypothetical protein
VPDWVSAPQAHSRVSNIKFDILIFFVERRGLYKYPMTSKIMPGPLTDMIAWVGGFATSSPEQVVKYQL